MQALPRTWSDLPAALLVRILQHVPLSTRLRTCARVCTRWAALSAAATTEVSCRHCYSIPATTALQGWLQLHGGQLLILQLNRCQLSRCLQPPWSSLSKLQKLQMYHIKGPLVCVPSDISSSSQQDLSRQVAATSSITEAISRPILPSLRELQLTCCEFATPSSFTALAQGPQLTSLVTIGNRFDRGANDLNARCVRAKCLPEQLQLQLVAAVSGLLQQLPQLSVLQLPEEPLSEAAVRHVGAMSELQQLSFELGARVPVSCLDSLPSSITQLCMTYAGAKNPEFAYPSLASRLQQLTAVVELSLQDFAVPPIVLAPLQQLRRVELVACSLLPAPAAADELHAGAAALLDLLASLTKLEQLQLHISDLSASNLPLQRFSALTASSHLTELTMSPYGLEGCPPLPLGSVEHMYPAGRQMPQLLKVDLSCTALGVGQGWMDSNGRDLQRIVSACPRLQSLHILGAVAHPFDMSALLNLPQSTTALSVGGDGVDDGHAGIIAQLTQLEDLMVSDTCLLTPKGVEELTALTRLTSLQLPSCRGLGMDLLDAIGDVAIVDGYYAEGPVWKQVQALLDLPGSEELQDSDSGYAGYGWYY